MHMNPSDHRTKHLACQAAVLLLGVLSITGAYLGAGEAPLWGALEAGPHAVGFKTFEEYDYRRTFQPKRDYFGEVVPGEKARPKGRAPPENVLAKRLCLD